MIWAFLGPFGGHRFYLRKNGTPLLVTFIIGFLLCFVLIGFVLVPIVYIGALIFTIMAAVKVSNGDMAYKYPLTIRLLK